MAAIQTSSRARRIGAAAALAAVIAIPAEGVRRTVYLDPGGIPTYCIGETKNPQHGKVYSLEECYALFDESMREAVEIVDRCVPGLPLHVQAAFADAVYNLGPRIACDEESSTAARLLAAGELEQACRQLPRWDRARVPGLGLVPLPGLTKRRAAEMELCLQGVE
jgi:GH24 family phage-related lysozyme (muramidase)